LLKHLLMGMVETAFDCALLVEGEVSLWYLHAYEMRNTSLERRS
jgi:hypothetical protein